MIHAGVADVNHNGRINDEVRSILQTTAQDLGARKRDDLYGFGLVNAVAAVAAAGGASAEATSSVTLVSYATSGAHGKNLVVSATVVDGEQHPVSGATVALAVSRNGSSAGTASGVTNKAGVASVQLANAPSGTYTTTITSVVAHRTQLGRHYAGERVHEVVPEGAVSRAASFQTECVTVTHVRVEPGCKAAILRRLRCRLRRIDAKYVGAHGSAIRTRREGMCRSHRPQPRHPPCRPRASRTARSPTTARSSSLRGESRMRRTPRPGRSLRQPPACVCPA